MDHKDYLITFPELLIWFPLIAGLVAFIIRKEKAVKTWAILASLITLGISVASLAYADNTKHFYLNNVSYFWLKYLGSNFSIGLDVGEVRVAKLAQQQALGADRKPGLVGRGHGRLGDPNPARGQDGPSPTPLCRGGRRDYIPGHAPDLR